MKRLMLDFNGRKPLAATVMAAVTALICFVCLVANLATSSLTDALRDELSQSVVFIGGRNIFELAAFVLIAVFIYTQAKRETKWLALPLFIVAVLTYLRLNFTGIFGVLSANYNSDLIGSSYLLYLLNLALNCLSTFLLFLAPFWTALAAYGLTLNKKPIYVFSGVSIFASALSAAVNLMFYTRFFPRAMALYYVGAIILSVLGVLCEASMNVTYMLLANAMSPQKVEIKSGPSRYGMPRRVEDAPQGESAETQKSNSDAPAETRKSDDNARAVSARLAELKKLLDDNLITPEEYDQKRSKLLEEL